MPKIYTNQQKKEWVKAYHEGKSVTEICASGKPSKNSLYKWIKEYNGFITENGTEIYRFIKTYIACDGHQGKVSDTFFVHRNTVNNYVKKAEDIMDIDLSSWEGRAKLYIACLLEAFLQN